MASASILTGVRSQKRSALSYNAFGGDSSVYGYPDFQSLIGTSKPLVAGEWGYGSAGTGGANVTPQLQADYLQRGMLINF